MKEASEMQIEQEKTEQTVPETAAEPAAADTPQEEKAPLSDADAVKKALSEALADCDRLRTELAACQDKYMRMLAEYDNYRKRTQKEREGTYTDAVCDTVKEILPVFDNLERAAAVGDPAKIAEGLALTVKQAAACLAKLKIEETAAVGGKFDPNLHNAVMHVEDDEHGDGEIVEVYQRGYRRGDKTVRDAMVKVAN